MTRVNLLLCALMLCSGAGCDISDSGSRKDDGRKLTVPKNTEIVAEGHGDLSFKAKRNGIVYVYDVDDSTTLFREQIREGQRFTISPEQNLATIDGKKVWQDDLKKKHEHRLYFEKK